MRNPTLLHCRILTLTGKKLTMCGRFALWTPPGTITRFFNITVLPEFAPEYNIAPGRGIIAIRQPEKNRRESALLRWGLIPRWAKEEKIGYKMINARAETLFEKASFKGAARSRRCLIPVSGFFEWKKEASGKQPYFIRLKTSDLFAVAGIWESWQNPGTGETINTCAIITTAANDAVSALHDRMPVIVSPERFDLWLDAGINDSGLLQPVMKPYDGNDMVCYPVGKAVNSTQHNDPSLITPKKLSPDASADAGSGLFSA